MYYLTLTKTERAVIEWIGPRYAHGADLRRFLDQCKTKLIGHDPDTMDDEDWEWDSKWVIEFAVPETAAWRIKELVEKDGRACFSSELVSKFTEFVSKIV